MAYQPGETDYSFHSSAAGNSVIVQADGKILVGTQSRFSTSVSNPRLVRLKTDGSLDTTFKVMPTNLFGEVFGMAIQHDGKILVAGLWSFTGQTNTSEVRLVRLDSQGNEDSTFHKVTLCRYDDTSLLWDHPLPIIVQPDDKVLAVTYSRFYSKLVRLMPSGVPDSTFSSPQRPGWTIPALMQDGRILAWSSTQSSLPSILARYEASGRLDPSFKPTLSTQYTTPYALSVLPDGKILLAGDIVLTGKSERNAVVRLTDAGAIDPSFALSRQINGQSTSMVVQSNGSFIAEGYRYTANGTLDAGFRPISRPQALAAQADGKIIGALTSPVYRFHNDPTATSLFASPSALGWVAGGSVPMVDEVRFYNPSGVLLGSGARLGSSPTWLLNGVKPVPGEMITVRAWQHQGNPSNSAYEWKMVPVQTDGPTVVNFASTHEQKPEGNSTSVTVKLSFPLFTTLRVPFKTQGTATAVNDYTLTPGREVVFQPGEIEKAIVLQSVSDQIIEPDEDVTLTLDALIGDAVVGSSSSFRCTILNNDYPPYIAQNTFSQVIAMGSPWELRAEIGNADGASVQWFKDGRPLASGRLDGASAVVGGDATRPSDAGSYRVRITGKGVTVWSDTYQVGVVDVSAQTTTVRLGGSLQVQVPAWGALNFGWTGPGIENGSVSESGSKLSKRSVDGSEIGDYVCHVTMKDGVSGVGETDVGVSIMLSTSAPVITQRAMAGQVGVAMEVPLAFSTEVSPPSEWTVSGLPLGLRLSQGSIVGTPQVPGVFRLTVGASNPSGKAASVVVILTIKALPSATVGFFEGTVTGYDAMQMMRSGRIEFVVSPGGTGTGRLWFGKEVFPLTGKGVLAPDPADESLDPSLAFEFQLSVPGSDPLALTLTIGLTSGTPHWFGNLRNALYLNDVASLTLWPRMADPSGYDGMHTVQLRSTSGFMGDGFAWLTVAKSGVATWVMRGVDGSTMTSSQALGLDGQLALYHLLYSNAGQLGGRLAVSPLGEVTGNLAQLKPNGAAADGSAFVERLQARGARYYAPGRGGIVMNLPDEIDNLLLSISDITSVAPSATINFLIRALPNGPVRLTSLDKATVRTVTSLRLLPSNGGFSGSTRFVDTDPLDNTKTVIRTGTFQGIIVNGVDGISDGRGFMLLPRMRTAFTTSTKTVSDSLPLRLLPN